MLTRWLVYHVASGHAFFTGAVCLIVAACLSYYARRRGIRTARNVLVLVGGSAVIVSATPLMPWAYLLLATVTLTWLAGEAYRKRLPDRWASRLRMSVALVWSAAMLAEVPYHLMPRVPPLGDPALGVIGDSVTAGIGGYEAVTWPALLADRNGVEVHDHSQMGANVASALRQAENLSPEERLVLLEIGGNDLLGETTPEEFEAGLDALVSAVSRPGRVVVLLELPLPPTYNAYGRIQRRLARRHRALLVPKRVLLGILGRGGATLDSIHLTQEGHRHMAGVVWVVVRGAYSDRQRDDRGP
ncbi:SGNH/GDSL hydrolase family protein [Tautonia plasticadhaerens]|uniref:Esterase TesA n=1 Tax=Tautonia plasticadhaerens TaxID=2527974 RepID=A0A518H9N2_9BACT|nr:GDSL-type esterase/lipase family protein [Tautonia plasticadhaerens]QDV37564.1 Esterase TesA precursor [Tautonia plasticadhaerens]